MKIDYDKPVKGRLGNGFYWMQFEDNPILDMAVVFANATRRYSPETIPGSIERWISDWRKLGWKFYPARLPRTSTGSKEE